MEARSLGWFALAVAAALMFALPAGASASRARSVTGPGGAEHRPGVVLVGFQPGVSPARRNAIRASVHARGARSLIAQAARSRAAGAPANGSVELLQLSSPAVADALQSLRGASGVRFAEPDYLMHESAAPNDPSFGLQWGDDNTGQLVDGTTGTAGADDRALDAWGVTTGSQSIVVGETDTGVDYTHPDLAANVWRNPGGIGGCSAGTRGWNVLTSKCDPMDDDTSYGGHGTHVAGIIGAVGNNGVGVAGMNWSTTILPVKWLDSNGNGYTSDLISALQWLVSAKQSGVNLRVVNDSATYVGTAYSQALSDEIDTLGSNGILFVTAAGNTGDDNDNLSYRRYPCGYDRPTEICVTASDQNDQLPSWANYGDQTVDLAAPGDNIYSTLRGGRYGYISGGSMAAAQVSGAAALILSTEPSLTVTGLRSDILDTVDPLPSLSGKVITGGRLDVCAAVSGCSTAPPPPPPTPTTLGTTTVGGTSDTIAANRKRVNRYSLSTSATVTGLEIYLQPGGASGQQGMKGVVYSDSGGSPSRLLAVTNELTFSSTDAPGWYAMSLSSPVTLAAGSYWIGMISGGSQHVAAFRYDSVSRSRAYNVNNYSAAPSDPFGSVTTDNELMSIYAVLGSSQSQPPPPPPPPPPAASPPANTSPPAISGTAQSGQTLTASTGSWTNSPTGYAYQWSRCDSGGSGCTNLSGATGQTYALTSADVGSTMRVAVTASNSGGSSAPASSGPTAVVTSPPAQGPATIGNTHVGGSTDTFAPDRKRVNRYSLGGNGGTLTSLKIYLAPTGTTGQQVLRGVVYSDSSGSPGRLLAVSAQLTFHSSDSAGWYEMSLPSPLSLPAGNVWIGVITGDSTHVAGFRYDSVSGSRYYNSDAYSDGPTDPFGSYSTDNEQMSLYGVYTPA